VILQLTWSKARQSLRLKFQLEQARPSWRSIENWVWLQMS